MRGSFVCPSSCSSFRCSISTTTTITLPLFFSLLSLLLLVLPRTYLTSPYLTLPLIIDHRWLEHSKSECPLYLSLRSALTEHMYYVTLPLPLLYQIHDASCELRVSVSMQNSSFKYSMRIVNVSTVRRFDVQGSFEAIGMDLVWRLWFSQRRRSSRTYSLRIEGGQSIPPFRI